jgi:hypothetical protein
MYFLEFSYDFDKHDLSYIWQNLAPRNSKNIVVSATSTSHELISSELLSEENLQENENLRWMVFKVKQRGQHDWNDLGVNSSVVTETDEGFINKFNWPYDYLSFVEKIKIDAQVLFKKPVVTAETEEEVATDTASESSDRSERFSQIVGGVVDATTELPVSYAPAGTTSTQTTAPGSVRTDTGKFGSSGGSSDSSGLDTMDIPDSDNTGNY